MHATEHATTLSATVATPRGTSRKRTLPFVTAQQGPTTQAPARHRPPLPHAHRSLSTQRPILLFLCALQSTRTTILRNLALSLSPARSTRLSLRPPHHDDPSFSIIKTPLLVPLSGSLTRGLNEAPSRNRPPPPPPPPSLFLPPPPPPTVKCHLSPLA